MNNRNTGILVAVILIAAALISFAILKSNKETVAPVESAATSNGEAAATPPAAPTADNPVVAKVDGVNVLRSEVVDFMKNFPAQMQQMPVETLFPIAVEQVVTAKIVDAKAAKGPSLENDPNVLKREAEAKTQIIRAVFLEKEIEKSVTEEKMKAVYEKFKAQQGDVQEVRARHILVATEQAAKDIIAKIEAGEKFEDLAKANSTDPSNKDKGGDLGYFTKDAMVKEFADAAIAMNKDEVSKTPVKTQFGYHVIQVLDKRQRPVPSYEEVKPSAAAEVRKETLEKIVADWRKDADVETFDINGNPVPEPEAK